MKQRRVTSFTIQLTSSRELAITMRRFKTAKTKRSKAFKQLVIPLYFLATKEIAIRHIRRSRKRRPLFPALQAYRLKQAAAVILVLAGLGGAVYFGVQVQAVSNANTLKPVKTFVTPPATPKKTVAKFLARSEPIKLSIPAVGIEAPVMNVGKDAEGGIETPPVLEWITGWYRYSPTPGEKGPAVIVGHVDSYKGISVFWRLREVTPGTEIMVTRADGTTVKFKVDALKQFDQANFPTQEVYSNIDHAGLRLITCGGSFNEQTGSYTQNTVVYASMIP